MGRHRSILMLVLLAVFFTAINLFANVTFRSARLDLTQSRLFTLSQSTKDVLASIDEPVTLRFFYSRELAEDQPKLRLYAGRIRDLLQEIRNHSGGKIRLELVEPKPFSNEEDVAMAYGLKPIRIGDDTNIYFGLVGTNLADGLETVPYFAEERRSFLEYDLARLIQTLAQAKKPVLGIVSNLPLDTGPGGLAAAMSGNAQPFGVFEELNKRFRVVFLEQQFTKVPADIDVLMVAHPKPLESATLYAIDQFAMHGGRILAFVDPWSEISRQAGPDGAPMRGATASSDLAPLLHHWGVDFNAGEILGDREFAMRVQGDGQSGLAESDYPLWIDVPKSRLASDDVTTASLSHVRFGTPGVLTKASGAATQFKPLIRSSDQARIFPSSIAEEAPEPELLMQQFDHGDQDKSEKISYVMAARITGPLTSIFEAQGAEAGSHLAQSSRDADIIVVADSDIFDDKFWLKRAGSGGASTPVADNAAFVLSAAESLANAGALIALRGRTPGDRPFTLMTGLRRASEQNFLTAQRNVQASIAAAEERLNVLQAHGSGNGSASDAAAQREIATLRTELMNARKSLRESRRNLGNEVGRISSRLKFLNIAAMPIFVALIALGLALLRHRQREALRGLRQ